MIKALRLKKIILDFKYNDKEDQIFKIYLSSQHDFEAVQDQLIEMELQIQKERQVKVWTSM